jgi:hypothetical protein
MHGRVHPHMRIATWPIDAEQRSRTDRQIAASGAFSQHMTNAAIISLQGVCYGVFNTFNLNKTRVAGLAPTQGIKYGLIKNDVIGSHLLNSHIQRLSVRVGVVDSFGHRARAID